MGAPLLGLPKSIYYYSNIGRLTFIFQPHVTNSITRIYLANSLGSDNLACCMLNDGQTGNADFFSDVYCTCLHSTVH